MKGVSTYYTEGSTAIKTLYAVNPVVVVLTIVAAFVEALCYPVLLVLVAQVFRVIAAADGTLPTATFLAGSLAVVLVLQAWLGVARDTLGSYLGDLASVRITSGVLEKISEIPYRLFEDRDFQGKYGLVVREAAVRSVMLVEAFMAALFAAVAFVGVVATLLILAPLLVLILSVAGALATVEVRFRRRIFELQSIASPELLRMTFLSQMNVDATWQRDLRVYRSNILSTEYSRIGNGYVGKLRTLLVRFGVMRAGIATVSALAIAGATFWVLRLLGTGSIQVAEAAILLPGLYFGMAQARGLASSAGRVTEGLQYARKLREFLGTDFGLPDALPASKGMGPRAAVRVTLDRVSLHYSSRPHPAIAECSFALEPGVTVLVGPNGAGKSTIVKILSGLLTPTEGEVAIEGPVGPLNRAVLFQEPAHFSLTIRQNVTMNSDADSQGENDSVWRALGQAGLSRVVRTLPDGLDTVVGASFGGVSDLSGGQWQRLALARLLYHDSPLIILDEPIASIDIEGERQTFALLRELATSRIVVFTTHRYDSLVATDRIIMLLDGRVVEEGRHGELLGLAGRYAQLVAANRANP